MEDGISVVGGHAVNAFLAAAVKTQQQEEEVAVPPPPPPPPNRRGRLRVRQISSRFMSPLVVSNSKVDQFPNPNPAAASESERSKSAQGRQEQQQELEVEPCTSSCADGNFPETATSLDCNSHRSSSPMSLTALGSHHSTKSVAHKKQQHQRMRPPSSSFNKENFDGSGTKSELQQSRSSIRVASRPDTPIVGSIGADRDRIVPSRYRQASQTFPHHRLAGAVTSTSSTPSAAAKLLQEATKSTAPVPLINYSITDTKQLSDVDDTTEQNNLSRISKSISIDHHSSHLPCTSTSAAATALMNTNRTRIVSNMRSSMPEVDHVLPTRWHAQTSFNNDLHTNSKFTASPCSRSLDFPHLNSQNSCSSSWLSLTTVASSAPTKTLAKNNQVVCLPPHPSSLKPGVPDARKCRKLLFNYQEAVHSLKLLYNYYLQWRFTNAKAEASMVSQKMDAEVCHNNH